MGTFDPKLLSDLAAEYEERGEDPLPVYRDLGAKGLAGLPFDPAYGGGGRAYRGDLDPIAGPARARGGPSGGAGGPTPGCDARHRPPRGGHPRGLRPAPHDVRRRG